MAAETAVTAPGAISAGTSGPDIREAVVQVHRFVETLAARRGAGVGLKLAEQHILLSLLAQPGIGQQHLANACNVAKSHMSVSLGSMELRGWVRREQKPGDSRSKKLFLTVEGRRMASKAAAIRSALADVVAGDMSPQELQAISDGLQRVVDRLAHTLGT